MSLRSLFTALIFCLLLQNLHAKELPNIVIIMADDMGYGDPHNLNPSSKIKTPALDRLAKEGMTFLDAHTPSAVCTPTRYGLLTGRYCWRSRLTRGVLNGYSSHLIDPQRETIASFLKNAGYKTGIVGKWHLGLDYVKTGSDTTQIDYTKPVTVGPNTYGFDYSFIIPASLDFPPYIYLRNHEIVQEPTLTQPAIKFPQFLRKGPRMPDLVMEDVLDDMVVEASTFIEKNANKANPFFLYMPLPAPHKPVWPHPRYVGKSKLGPYGDFVMQVDEAVGSVLQVIDHQKITDNTLVVYTSDNGSFMYRLEDETESDHLEDETIQGYHPKNHRANNMLRGTKADIWEAGHRVPFFARWPKTIQASSKSDQTTCLTDLFATCAAITGKDLPLNAAEDSFSLLPIFNGNSNRIDRAPVIHHSGAGMFAIRDGDWKLVLGNGSGGRQQPRGKPFEKPYELYNLKSDIAEQKNLASELPEKVESLTKKANQLRKAGRSR